MHAAWWIDTLTSMSEREVLPPSIVDRKAPAPEPLSPRATLAVVLTGVLAAAWFTVSWLVLHSPLTDAIGETAGSLAAGLLIVSIFGAARDR
jgi:hypothetical protein